jgi:DNA-binding response OmpR family regulator
MTNVLVVDDDPGVVELVSYKLTGAGYAVDAAPDGEAALSKVDKGGVDLLLLDILMPGISGLEVLERLRSAEPTSRLPVIMLTAKAQEADVERGFELGADDYIVKPFSPRELVSRVRAVLARTAP